MLTKYTIRWLVLYNIFMGLVGCEKVDILVVIAASWKCALVHNFCKK